MDRKGLPLLDAGDLLEFIVGNVNRVLEAHVGADHEVCFEAPGGDGFVHVQGILDGFAQLFADGPKVAVVDEAFVSSAD